MPRSGTRLLRGLLNQHSRIRVNDIETEFFPFLVRWVDAHGEPGSDTAIRELYATLSRGSYFTYRNARLPAFSCSDWARWCNDRFDAAGLFEGFLRYELALAPGSGVIWADKSPSYITCLELLSTHFPGSRVIHLVRDVRDYCVSISRAWHKDARRAAHRWGEDVLNAHRHCATHPDRCIEVRYEDLVGAPVAELTRVCDFLALPFEPRMARLAKPEASDGDARGLTEIVTRGVGKYASALTPREQRILESLGWSAMCALGYEPAFAHRQARLGRVSLLYRRLKDGLQLLNKDRARFGALRALRFHTQRQRVSRL